MKANLLLANVAHIAPNDYTPTALLFMFSLTFAVNVFSHSVIYSLLFFLLFYYTNQCPMFNLVPV